MRRRHSSRSSQCWRCRGAGGGAAPAKTVRLAIAHVVSHCHVWRTPAKLLGPTLEDHGRARGRASSSGPTARWTSTSRRRRGRGSRSATRARTRAARARSPSARPASTASPRRTCRRRRSAGSTVLGEREHAHADRRRQVAREPTNARSRVSPSVAPSRNAAPSGQAALRAVRALRPRSRCSSSRCAATIVLRRAGESESVRDARRLTEVLGRSVVEPNLDDGVVRGNRVQLATFDRLVRERVLQ